MNFLLLISKYMFVMLRLYLSDKPGNIQAIIIKRDDRVFNNESLYLCEPVRLYNLRYISFLYIVSTIRYSIILSY